MKFRAIVESAGKTATGIEVPAEVVAALGHGKRPPVHVTINEHTYRSTVAVMGGRFMLGINAENREKAGVGGGDDIEVELELDTEPRTLAVPADLAAELAGDPVAAGRFDALSYSARQRMVLSVEAAKTPETRQRRIAKTMDDLRRAAGPGGR